MKRKTNHKQQSPFEICKQITLDLKRETDPIQQELLRQRLHHYTLLLKNKKDQ